MLFRLNESDALLARMRSLIAQDFTPHTLVHHARWQNARW